MTQGQLELRELGDGQLQLTWPQANRQDRYLLEIREPGNTEGPYVYYRVFTADNTWKLPPLPTDKALTFSIRTVVDYKQLWMEKERISENELSLNITLTPPTLQGMGWVADENSKTVTFTYDLGANEWCRLYWKDASGQWQEVQDTDQTELVLTFGDKGEFPVPSFGEKTFFQADVYQMDANLVYYGNISYNFAVERDDLLGRDLNPEIVDNGYNVSTITWDETKGQTYQVQRFDETTGQWEILTEIPGDGVRTYTTDHMAVNRTFTYRVVAVGGQTMPDSEFAAVSDDLVQETKESPIYCTIWPLKDLKTYADPQKTTAVGTIKAGSAWCVVEEQGDMFGIRQSGEIRYVESNYCLINLPEYMDDLCLYDITNSYKSLYMVHEFEIPKVTAVVTKGYEKVKLQSGEYLVPLLYPTAKRLVTAARTALEEGYRLKIYDAFRPQAATVQIYDLTEKMLDKELPEKPYTKKFTVAELKLPKPRKETDPETNEEKEVPLTYEDVMLGEEYTLNYFLAKGGSMHNLGLALDLTMVDLSTGKEMKMQTSMHDLSCYSVLAKNNKAAKKLTEIMTSAGFGGLVSEWWHFQDNEARKTINPPALWNGVNPGSWMADDHGWRFRNSSGVYCKDGTFTIDGTKYAFDAEGYVITE
jgi:D-alanyl-D-alanine dipeptidase